MFQQTVEAGRRQEDARQAVPVAGGDGKGFQPVPLAGQPGLPAGHQRPRPADEGAADGDRHESTRRQVQPVPEAGPRPDRRHRGAQQGRPPVSAAAATPPPPAAGRPQLRRPPPALALVPPRPPPPGQRLARQAPTAPSPPATPKRPPPNPPIARVCFMCESEPCEAPVGAAATLLTQELYLIIVKIVLYKSHSHTHTLLIMPIKDARAQWNLTQFASCIILYSPKLEMSNFVGNFQSATGGSPAADFPALRHRVQ